MLYISNAFSLSMLDKEQQSLPYLTGGRLGGRIAWPRYPRPIHLDEARDFVVKFADGIESVVGHQGTAAIIGGLLGVETPYNRKSIKLNLEDTLLVAQYVGPRLPEGATELPEGATFEWWIV